MNRRIALIGHTGSVMRDDLKLKLAEIAIKHDVVLISPQQANNRRGTHGYSVFLDEVVTSPQKKQQQL